MPTALLLLPVISALMAIFVGGLVYQLAVPGICAVILWRVNRGRPDRHHTWVGLAFVFSMIGDSFLYDRGDDLNRFILGIAAFFVAHIGYLGFARATGAMHRVATGVLYLVYLPFYVWQLAPAIEEAVLSVAVLVYLLISVLTLGTAIGSRLAPIAKTSYIAGIALIVISDTFIAFNEFLGWSAWGRWVIPTYLAAHIVITYGLIRRATEEAGS